MMERLNITLIQSKLHWEDAGANRKMFAEKISQLGRETHIILLPEMFTTGFTMNASHLAEPMNGPTLLWMQEQSQKTGAAVVGSIIVKEAGMFYNRLLWVEGTGTLHTYDKKHTFTLAGEDKVYASGNKKLIVDYQGWKICPLICYDLRFPVWSRNVDDYDVLLFVANWPEKRVQAWDTLLKARAIENMAYCVGLNRVGLDGNNHAYVGHSAVYDVLGNPISCADYEQEFVETIVLSKEHVFQNRGHLQFLRDRDAFILH